MIRILNTNESNKFMKNTSLFIKILVPVFLILVLVFFLYFAGNFKCFKAKVIYNYDNNSIPEQSFPVVQEINHKSNRFEYRFSESYTEINAKFNIDLKDGDIVWIICKADTKEITPQMIEVIFIKKI